MAFCPVDMESLDGLSPWTEIAGFFVVFLALCSQGWVGCGIAIQICDRQASLSLGLTARQVNSAPAAC